MEKVGGSYRKAVEVVKGLCLANVNVKDQGKVQDFINQYGFDADLYKTVILEAQAVDIQLTNAVLNFVVSLCGPISLETLENILLLNQQDQAKPILLKNILIILARLFYA
mmetsp:Transcript_39480/g.37928  ORF Transcript_39480/g.37928 Transcript_39480/m.37928 type:complete len:110 (-) Transcript_39480:1500-1829(-)